MDVEKKSDKLTDGGFKFSVTVADFDIDYFYNQEASEEKKSGIEGKSTMLDLTVYSELANSKMWKSREQPTPTTIL